MTFCLNAKIIQGCTVVYLSHQVVEDTKTIPVFIGSYTEDMQGLTLGVRPTKDGHRSNDPLGEGIYSVKLRCSDSTGCAFNDWQSTLAHNSTNVWDYDMVSFRYLGKNPAFVKVVPDRAMLLATSEFPFGYDPLSASGIQSFNIAVLLSEDASDHHAVQNFDAMRHEGAQLATYIDILTEYRGDNSTQYFGVAEYGGAAQQFTFDGQGVSDFKVTDWAQAGENHPHCFRYVPQSILQDDSQCLALVSDLGNDIVRQFDCTNGDMKDFEQNLSVTAARHIDFAGNYAIVVSEDGDSSDTDRVGSDVDSTPQIQSFVYDEVHGHFNPNKYYRTSLLKDSWEEDAIKDNSPLYQYLVSSNEKTGKKAEFGAKGSDVHVHPTNSSIVYASTRGYDRIVRFHLDSETGSLKRMKEFPTSVGGMTGYTPRTFEIVEVEKDNKYVMLVSNQDSSNVSLFNIHANGDLEGVQVLQTPFPTSTSAYNK